MSEVNSKKCSNCCEVKLLNLFSKKKGGKSGHASICKECINSYSKQFYSNNKEKRSVSLTKYRSENKNKIKKYYIDNREKLNASSKENYHNNKEDRSNQRKARYIKDIVVMTSRRKKYYNDNKEAISKSRTKKTRIRLITDSDFRMKTTIRDRFRAEIKSRYPNRSWRIMFELTGYSSKDYINHFDKNLFEKYKKTSDYHIDHIIPVSLYDFNNMKDVVNCWNPKNLRIITKEENHAKSNKVDVDLIKLYNIEHLLPEGAKYE